MTFAKAQKMFIGIVIIAVIGVSVGGCQEKPEKYTGPVEKITLAAYAGETGALVYVAEDQGFFEENGLEVTIKDYESGKAAADALIDGEADIATSAVAGVNSLKNIPGLLRKLLWQQLSILLVP
ncbi:hypothetical protein ES703_119168 [subsurface metagenome]